MGVSRVVHDALTKAKVSSEDRVCLLLPFLRGNPNQEMVFPVNQKKQNSFLLGVSRVVHDALTKRRPPVRIACVYKFLFSWFIPVFLPARLVDWMLAGVFGIKPLPRLKKEE